MGALMPLNEKVKDAQALMEKLKPQMQDLLPTHCTPERMIRVARAMLSRNPKLAECSTLSLIGAVVECAVLGLEPNTTLGHAYIIPFRNNKINMSEATLIIGYQGYMDLAYRTDRIAAFSSEIVYERDVFSVQYGTDRRIKHIPAQGKKRGEMIGVYAVAELSNGGKPFVYLTREEVMSYKAKSRGADSDYSPWNSKDTEPSMWRKTAIRRLATWIPKSIEFASALAVDASGEIGSPQYKILDVQSSVVQDARAEAEQAEQAASLRERQAAARQEEPPEEQPQPAPKPRRGRKPGSKNKPKPPEPTPEPMEPAETVGAPGDDPFGNEAPPRPETPPDPFADLPDHSEEHKQVVSMLAKKSDVAYGAAYAKLDDFCRKIHVEAFANMTDTQLSGIRSLVESGHISM